MLGQTFCLRSCSSQKAVGTCVHGHNLRGKQIDDVNQNFKRVLLLLEIPRVGTKRVQDGSLASTGLPDGRECGAGRAGR